MKAAPAQAESFRSRVRFVLRAPAQLIGSASVCRRLSISRLRLLAAKTASARRGSRMRSTGEAGVRGAHVLDACRALAETCRQERMAHRTASDTSGSCSYISASGPEPDCLTRLVSEHDQPHIRSPLETAAPTSRLRRAGLRRTKPFFQSAFQAMDYLGSSTRIRQNRSGPGRFANLIGGGSGDLHHGSLDDDAGGDIFPQRHEKLAGERDGDRLLHAAAVAFDPFLEPESQR